MDKWLHAKGYKEKKECSRKGCELNQNQEGWVYVSLNSPFLETWG